VTRRWLVVMAALIVVAVVGAGVTFFLVRDRGETTVAREPGVGGGLTLLIVQTDTGAFGAVVGATGGPHGALALPSEIQVTIPGQGEGTLQEALELPPRQAATTVANVLGVWVNHYAVIGPERLRDVVDRSGGITVGAERQTGAQVLSALGDTGPSGTAALTLALTGLLSGEVEWEPSDFVDSDDVSTVIETLDATRGATVTSVPAVEAATDIFQVEPDAVRASLVEAFGGPDRDTVRVIVLNGSGVPGVGELVAERIVPGGFRIVVSENASSFDHDETLVVVGSPEDVALGERVRDLLGTGTVNVSISSGLAPVTVLVGKDFTG
jgi:hypothetical protein